MVALVNMTAKLQHRDYDTLFKEASLVMEGSPIGYHQYFDLLFIRVLQLRITLWGVLSVSCSLCLSLRRPHCRLCQGWWDLCCSPLFIRHIQLMHCTVIMRENIWMMMAVLEMYIKDRHSKFCAVSEWCGACWCLHTILLQLTRPTWLHLSGLVGCNKLINVCK